MQKIKRIVKKIGAISTGAAFLGATLMGAMAADLSAYPSPFVQSGAANNAVIIHSANGLDSGSAGYILTGLAGAVTAKTGGTVTDVAGGYKFEYSGNRFNLNDTAYDVDTKLSKTQMPILLKKGTFQDDEGTNTGDTEYVQEVLFTNKGESDSEKSIWYIYDQDSEDNNKPMGDYLYLSKSSNIWAWTYNFNLDSAVTTADSADLESTKLELMGRIFTVSNVGFTTGNVTKLTLLAGDVSQTVATGETVNGVTLVAVDTNGNSCTIEYQGSTETINKGSTKTMADGTIIGVSKVTPSNKQATPDYCELNIGADKVEIENGKEVKVNGDTVTGSKVTFTSTNGFDQFNVSYKPSDKVFLKPGEEYEDPVLGTFKLIFGGVVEDSPEDVIIEASGEKVDITATNKDGDTTKWTAVFANTTGTGDLMPGADIDEPFIYQEKDWVTNTSMGESELSGMSGIRFLYSMNDRSHIVKIKSIDTLNNKTTFYDETTQTEYADQEWTSNVSSSFSFLPSTFSLTFARGEEHARDGIRNTTDIVIFDNINDEGPSYFLKNGGNLTFRGNWSVSSYHPSAVSGDLPFMLASVHPYWMTFGESDTSKETNIPETVLGFNLTYDSSNQEINLAAVVSNGQNYFVHRTSSLKQKDKSDTTMKAGKTIYGTYVEQITPTGSGTDSVTIKTPDSATYANVWIAPTSASVSTSEETATGIDLMSEDEVSDVSMYNAIVVGGPAANKIAASLLELAYPAIGTDSGLDVGEAMIKMVDNGANVAMLVFGWEKDDTARAAKVLQDFGTYDLSGEEVSVSGTTANPTVVTA